MIGAMPAQPKPRSVAIVAYSEVQSLDVTGPLEVFAGAQQLIEAAHRPEPPYEVRVLSRDGRPLRGRRATTHWSEAAALARAYSRIEVDPEPIFVRDGAVWTSAGVSAGMDLALALVEQDLDRDAAMLIARHLVLFLRRPGNQSQFSAAMAARAHMSPRHFARAFRAAEAA